MSDTPIEYPESFANYPASISETKGDKSNNAADWKPRDALIAALRDLDAGRIKPTALVVACDNGDNTCSYFACSPSLIVTMGLLEWVRSRMFELRDMAK